MPVADSVKNYKQLLGQLAAAHEKASTRLANAEAKRSEVIAVQDRLVAETAKGVDRAVVDMANGVGPELTSGVLGIDVVEVRRQVKSDRR